MTRFAAIFLAFSLTLSAADKVYVLKAARLFDGKSDRLVSPGLVVVSGDKILAVGTIEIFSHDDTTPNLYMRGIPHARQLFTTLEQRIIAVKRQRGVLKVDAGT